MPIAEIAARLAMLSAGQSLDLRTIDACRPLCMGVFGSQGTVLHLGSAPETSPNGAAVRVRGSAVLMGVEDVDVSIVFAEDADGVSTHVRASMPAAETIPIPGLPLLSICDLTLLFDVSAGGLITARVAGSVPFDEGPEARMPLCVELPISGGSWAFYGGVDAAFQVGDGDDVASSSQIPLTMSALCKRLSLPSLAAALPDGLSNVGLTSFSFITEEQRVTSLSIALSTVPEWTWELEPGLRLDRFWASTAVTEPTGTPGFLVALGGRLMLGGGRLELAADGSRSWGGTGDGGWKLHAVATSHVEIAAGVSIEDVALTLSRSGHTWDIGGSVDVRLMDHHKPIQLAVDTTIARAAGEVHLSAKNLDLAVLTLPAWNGSLVVEDASCTIRGHQDGSASGRTLPPAFELQATARLTWSDGQLRGKLKISTDEDHPQLRFDIDGEATITLPKPSQMPGPQVVLSNVHADISRDASSGWRFDGGTTFRLAGLSPRIQAAMPSAMAFDLTLTSTSLTFTARNPPLGLRIALPHTQGSKPNALGTVGLRIESLALDIDGQGVTFDTTVGVTLPREINSVFGGRNVLMTGKELGVRFIAGLIDGKPGFSVDLLDLPFTAFQTGPDGNVHWDLGSAGEVTFTIPKIVCTTSSFTVNLSVHENPQRPLQLPLVSVKHALSLRLPAAVTNEIPDYVPLRSPSLFSEPAAGQPSTLKAPEFIERFHLTGEAAAAVTTLAAAMDRLPDRFKDYLRGEGPTGLDLNLSITPTGTVSVDLSLDTQPVKVLFPAGAEIVGIELRSVSFGEVLGGALFELRLDASIDTFDMPALAVCVSGAGDKVPALDYLSTMRDTFFAEKLLAFIVYETGVPLPIPLFCNRLGIDYKGLLGVEARTSWSFPEPSVDVGTFFAEAKGLWDFVSVPTAPFPTSISLPFTVGESYIALPPYLGQDRYIGIKGANVFHGDAASLVAHVADGIKFFSVFNALLAIPISKRVGAVAVSLGPLAVNADWIVCTAREFHDTLTPKTADIPPALAPLMALTPDDKRSFLAAAPSAGGAVAPTDERRIVILLAGGVTIDHLAGLHASFALVSGGRSGVFSSVHISGALAGALRVDLRGSVESEARNAAGDESFVIHASGQILVGTRPLLVAHGDARAANGTLTFRGDLKVLPNLPELSFSAEGQASFSEHAFAVAGSVNIHALGVQGTSAFRLDPGRFECTETITGMVFGLWSGSLRISGTSLADRKHLTVIGTVAATSLGEAITTQVSNAVTAQLTAFEKQLQHAIDGYKDEGWLAWTVGGGAITEAYLKLLHRYVVELQAAIKLGSAIQSFEARVITEIGRRLGPFGTVVPYLTGGAFAVSLTSASFTASLDDGVNGKVRLTVSGAVVGAGSGSWTFDTDLSSVVAVAKGLVTACFGSGTAVAAV